MKRPAKGVRCTSEYLGGTKFRFTCPEGHAHTQDLGKGPKSRALSEGACRVMARWWGDGGVTVNCKECDDGQA